MTVPIIATHTVMSTNITNLFCHCIKLPVNNYNSVKLKKRDTKMKASEWLKAANKEGLTDYRLAKELQKPPQYVSKYKRGDCPTLTPDMVRIISENTSLNAIEMTLDQAGEKSKTEESKEYFKHLAKTATAATIMASTALLADLNYVTQCILCSIGKKHTYY